MEIGAKQSNKEGGPKKKQARKNAPPQYEQLFEVDSKALTQSC